MSVNCPDCDVEPNEPHLEGCDVERCATCGGQKISCDCEPLPWTGEWPGVAECREFGWYCVMRPGEGWVRCGKDDPGATEDLNRLAWDAIWDSKTRTWNKKKE